MSIQKYISFDGFWKIQLLGRGNQWLIKDILGEQNIHPDIPSKKFVAFVAAKKWSKT